MILQELCFCLHVSSQRDVFALEGASVLTIVVVVQSLSLVRLFATLWTVTCQGPPVHGILQARILEGVAISFFRGSSQPRDQTLISYVSRIATWVLYHQHHLRSLKCDQQLGLIFRENYSMPEFT